MFALIRAANELAQLSNFAGRQLGFANYQLWKSGSLLPFGMAVAVSFWKGATNQITIIRVEDPKLIAQAAPFTGSMGSTREQNGSALHSIPTSLWRGAVRERRPYA
jgi:hypothetical protein